MSALWTARQEGMPAVGEVIKRSPSCAELFPDDLLQHYRSKYGKWCHVFYAPVKTDQFVFLRLARLFIYEEKIDFTGNRFYLVRCFFLSMWRKGPDSLECIRLNKDQFSVCGVTTAFYHFLTFFSCSQMSTSSHGSPRLLRFDRRRKKIQLMC